MEVWKVALTALGLALTLVLVAFRQRQLYILVPKLFEHTPLSDDGRVVEITLINKGWLMEEEVKVEFPPGQKIELLAANSAGVNYEKRTVAITRLPQRSDLKLVLLFEGSPPLAPITPKVTSKTSLGRLVSESNVPPNFGIAGLMLVGFLAVMSSMAYFIELQKQRLEVLRTENEVSSRKFENTRENEIQSLRKQITQLRSEIEDERAKCVATGNDELVKRLELASCLNKVKLLEFRLQIEDSQPNG